MIEKPRAGLKAVDCCVGHGSQIRASGVFTAVMATNLEIRASELRKTCVSPGEPRVINSRQRGAREALKVLVNALTWVRKHVPMHSVHTMYPCIYYHKQQVHRWNSISHNDIYRSGHICHNLQA